MSFLNLRFAFIYILVTLVSAERDLTLCDIEKISNGLIPPGLPTNFEMKYETVDLKSKSIWFNEFYFDNDGQRGKYILTSRGTQFNGIANYEVGQAVTYIKLHPGSPYKRDPLSQTCTTQNIEYSALKSLFGYRKSNKGNKRSRMFNSYEALRFGGSNPYSFQGYKYLDNRGLNTTVFRGCIYEKYDDETDHVYFYFSDEGTVPAGGTSENVVDGIKDGPLSVPLGRHVEGVTTVRLNNSNPEKLFLNHTDHFVWFKGEPNFALDVFRIPDYMECKNYRGSKEMPELPPGFSVRYELTTFTQNMEGKAITARMTYNREIYYDYEKKLARLDFKPLKEMDSEIFSLFQSDEPVRAIFDYYAGIKYIIHKTTGRCFAKPIEVTDIFDADHTGLYLKMANPKEVLSIQTDDNPEYKGKYIVRDTVTDVWNGHFSIQEPNISYTKEIYMTTDGWHEESEDTLKFWVPVRLSTIYNLMENGENQQTITEKNFFRFKSQTPPLKTFDITGCIEHVQHQFFAIILSVEQKSEDTLMRTRWDFQQVAQYYISQASKLLTALRIQRVTLRKVDVRLVVTFAILGKMDLKTKNMDSEKGPLIEEAVSNLRTTINSGKFSFKFTPPSHDDFNDPEDIYIFAAPGSLHSFKINSLFMEPLGNVKPSIHHEKDSFILRGDKKPTGDPQRKGRGMPPGGLAALAIVMLLLGIGIGVALIYIYIRKYGASSVPDQYAMQKK